MLIRISIESTQPLAGTAATDDAEPLRFDGWLELLKVISALVASPSGAGADDATAIPEAPGDAG